MSVALLFTAALSVESDGSPCGGNSWPDANGCCPKKIDKIGLFYRDFQGCYPNKQGLYADSNGCYPDEKGNYLNAGEVCPKDRKCHKRCIKPKKD